MSTMSWEITNTQADETYDVDIEDFERMKYIDQFEKAVSKRVQDQIDEGDPVVDLKRSSWASRLIGQVEHNIKEIEDHYGVHESGLRDVADYIIANQVIESFKQKPTDRNLKKALYNLPLSSDTAEQLILEAYEEYRELHDLKNNHEKKYLESEDHTKAVDIDTAIGAAGETFAGLSASV